MGGGGEDFEAAEARREAKRQESRDALNLMFGVKPTAGMPTRDQFTKPGGNGQWIETGESGGYYDTAPSAFDQAGYDAALDAFNASGSEAGKNKTARDALYGKIRNDAFTAGRRGFDEDYERAARDNRFALFAQGLRGGSVDVDENALLKRTQDRGLLELGGKADAAKADIRGSDEQTRLGLLQSIVAGMDQGSALSSALGQLKVNSDRAAAEAIGTDLGDLFATSGLLYTKSQAARGKQDARNWFDTQYPQRRPSGGSSGGIITSRG